jgi:2-polyprenyl-6-methoxyphenol hydroxylase-like FAD-dependent oxidoreductase
METTTDVTRRIQARRIACVGGGPGGLFFATLVKTAHPEVEVTLFERNRADDTFGFGVVFSDATLAAIHAADPVLLTAMEQYGVHWDQIEVRLKDERIRCAGNGMTAVVRQTLLGLLQERAKHAGVDLRFESEVELDDLEGYDLVVAADGANSRLRDRLADHFQPSVETAAAKFIWFGTSYLFDGLTFVHTRGEDGVFAVHGYPISPEMSTFIVETDEETWRRAGLDEFDVTQPPGPSDLKTKAYLEKLFAEEIDGQPLLVNNSRWGSFRTRRAGSWHHGNVALLGDSAHTAHFSVGSGTKMAMEDAIELAAALDRHPHDLGAALAAYEAAARPAVERIQGSARPSLSWWEHFGRYHDVLEPWQFAFHFLSRSIDVDRIARRDPDFVSTVRSQWRERTGYDVLATPAEIGPVTLPGRQVEIVESDSGTFARHPGDADVLLPLLEERPRSATQPWGLWFEAPYDEAALPSTLATLRVRLGEHPDLVAVHGGSALARTLLAEECRMVAGVPSLLVEDDPTPEHVETLVLAGRADLVGTRSVVPARSEAL